ncbi:MAG: carboxypeptidase M32 [Rhodoferax sp.]|jgi:carboxypeptidase Taq|nr:carboxypeptidase M32 [Rhodoferax sp.]
MNATTTPFAALDERIGAINDVLNAASVLVWDSRTMMPAGGAASRGLQISTLTRVALDMLLHADTARALDTAESALPHAAPDNLHHAMVAQVRQAVEHHRRVPAALTQQRAALRTVAQAAWIEARARSDFSIFAPHLKETMALSRQHADCAGWNGHPYDAMVAAYEPGETAVSLKRLFAELRAGILPILEQARARPPARRDFLFRDFPEEGQRAFGRQLAERLGYDFQRGRLDSTVHPFEVSFTREDVRITTRYNRNYLPASLFGTAHETGHALYEQGVSPAYTRTVFATDLIGLYAVGGTSFGMHESQSRLWENHIVRSRDFWRLNFADLQSKFPEQLGDVDAEAFYRAVTHTEPGLIRVEADELTYDLHVMLRVELECALMDGSLDVADLPRVWNDTIRRDLGVEVPNDAKGVLQDIHWSTGYVGSFPSYTIGNVTAAQLMDSLRRDDPDLDAAVARGDYAVLADKLRTEVWQHGRRFTRDEMLTRTTGRPLEAGPYIAYLRGKYATGN